MAKTWHHAFEEGSRERGSRGAEEGATGKRRAVAMFTAFIVKENYGLEKSGLRTVSRMGVRTS